MSIFGETAPPTGKWSTTVINTSHANKTLITVMEPEAETDY